jgi:phage FluMu protein Com
MDNSFFKEYRCDCGKLLFKGYLAVATIEIKCKRCGRLNSFREDLSRKIPTSFALKIKAGDSVKPGDLEERGVI